MPRPKTDEGRIRRVLLLSMIRKYYRENGYPPTLAVLARDAEMPRTTLKWHLESLREQGYLRFEDEDVSRTLRPTRKDSEMEKVE